MWFSSVTEREVIHGILRAHRPTLHTHCYVRTLQDLNTSIVRVARNFMDFNGLKVDDEAQKLLTLLKVGGLFYWLIYRPPPLPPSPPSLLFLGHKNPCGSPGVQHHSALDPVVQRRRHESRQRRASK